MRSPGLAVAIALALAAATAQAEVVEVVVAKRQFTPAALTVRVGTTVKWVNREQRDNHSVLFEGGAIPESERFFPGESWQYTFTAPGRYPYRCGPHPEMTGVIEVLP